MSETTETGKYPTLAAPASRENPRTLKKVNGDGTSHVVTDPGEYLSMTSAQGYLDITDGDPGEAHEGTATEAAPARAENGRAAGAPQPAASPARSSTPARGANTASAASAGSEGGA